MIDACGRGATSSPASRNMLIDHYDRLPAIARKIEERYGFPSPPGGFRPAVTVPDLDDRMREFLAPAQVRMLDLGSYRGHGLRLLDLMANPGTHTTKTFASLLIVARAVSHIQRTGEPVLIVSPTSGNKGTALRNAVQRAVDSGLVTDEQLRIAIIVPASGLGKLRASDLSEQPRRHELNPILVLHSDEPEDVKAFGRAFAESNAEVIKRRFGHALWFSLSIENYLMADAARAFAVHELSEPHPPPRFWNAHAVSSAFGLLGYQLGRELMEETGMVDPADHPGYFLIQHLGTPDMVLNLLTGSFDHAGLPRYQRSAAPIGRRGHDRWEQSSDPHYPAYTSSPTDVLDATFYSRVPATSPVMNTLVERHGGGGIVVSRLECEDRFSQVRQLPHLGELLPARTADLYEWSLLMAMTGTMLAIDRGLVPAGVDVLVHGSGSYDARAVTPLPAESTTSVSSPEELLGRLFPASVGTPR